MILKNGINYLLSQSIIILKWVSSNASETKLQVIKHSKGKLKILFFQVREHDDGVVNI